MKSIPSETARNRCAMGLLHSRQLSKRVAVEVRYEAVTSWRGVSSEDVKLRSASITVWYRNSTWTGRMTPLAAMSCSAFSLARARFLRTCHWDQTGRPSRCVSAIGSSSGRFAGSGKSPFASFPACAAIDTVQLTCRLPRGDFLTAKRASRPLLTSRECGQVPHRAPWVSGTGCSGRRVPQSPG